jgi:hypothetical protein
MLANQHLSGTVRSEMNRYLVLKEMSIWILQKYRC